MQSVATIERYTRLTLSPSESFDPTRLLEYHHCVHFATHLEGLRTMPRFIAPLFMVLWVCQPIGAAVIYDNPAGVTSAPSGDRGWNSTGFFDNADGSAVAISPHYFLSAVHLGGGTAAYLAGTNFPLMQSWTIPNTDIYIGEVSGTLPYYSPLYSGAAGTEVGKTISMVGWGFYAQGSTLTTNSIQNGWYWNQIPLAENYASNVVTAVSPVNFNGTTSSHLLISFTPTSGTGIYTSHDSGGGNFIFNNGAWQLAGITHAVSSYYTFDSSSGTYTPLYNPVSDHGAVVYNSTGLFVATAFDTNGNPTAYVPASGAPQTGYATEVAPYISQINAITGLPEPGIAGLVIMSAVGLLLRRRQSRICNTSVLEDRT